MRLIIESYDPLDPQNPDRPRPGRYHGYVDGRRIVTNARTPFYSAARALLKEGVDPETLLEMQHEALEIVSMRGKVGGLAKLAVEEGDRSGPRTVKFREFSATPPREE